VFPPTPRSVRVWAVLEHSNSPEASDGQEKSEPAPEQGSRVNASQSRTRTLSLLVLSLIAALGVLGLAGLLVNYLGK
jgi:hypothetical protein